MQSFTSSVFWECPECEHANDQEVEVPQLNFAAEKSSDMAVDDVAEIVCDDCGTEYYGHVFVNMGGADFELEEPHKFSISGDMPMYGPDEDDFEPPDDPHSIAREALGQLSSMVGTYAPENDTQFTNRLVFGGAVSVMEAYLGDTLVNAVLSDSKVRIELLTKNAKLGAEKVSAAERAADPDAMIKRIVVQLRGYLFHNLSVVTALYRSAFGINLMPSKVERDILFQAMPRRHDCVHRNGRNKDGNKLNDYTDAYVGKVIDAVITVVDHVEQERLRNLPF